jgi:hypothetical protein
VQVLSVGYAVVVEHHEIEDQSLSSQVLVRLQQIAEELELGALGNACQDDRQVARDAVPPERGLTLPIGLHRFGRSKARIAVEQSAREPLEVDRILDRQAEMPQLDLRVGARQRHRVRDSARGRNTSRSAVGAPVSLSAKPVVNDKRAVPPGGSRIARAEADDRTSTAPVVPESGRAR